MKKKQDDKKVTPLTHLGILSKQILNEISKQIKMSMVNKIIMTFSKISPFLKVFSIPNLLLLTVTDTYVLIPTVNDTS